MTDIEPSSEPCNSSFSLIAPESEQKERWQQIRRAIHLILNRINPLTLQKLAPELLNIHLNIFIGPFSKALLEFIPLTYNSKHCTPSPQSDGALIAQPYHCFGILVAVLNTFCPEAAMLITVRCMHRFFKEFFRIFPELTDIFTRNPSQQKNKLQQSYAQSQINSIQAYLSFLGLLTSIRVINTEMLLYLLSKLLSHPVLSAIGCANGDGSLNTNGCEIVIGFVTQVMRESSDFYRVSNSAGFQQLIDRCRVLYQNGSKKSASSSLSIRSIVYLEETFEYFATLSRKGARPHVTMSILTGNTFYHLEEMQITHTVSISGVLSTLNGSAEGEEIDKKYDPKTFLDYFVLIETEEDVRTMLCKEREWESSKERVLGQSEIKFLIHQETVNEECITDIPPISDDETPVEEPENASETPENVEPDTDINFDTSNFLYQVQLGEIRKAIVLIISGSNSAAEAAHKIMELTATKREDKTLSEKLDTRAIELIVCQIIIQVIMHHSSMSQGLEGANAESNDSAGEIFRIAKSSGSGSTNAFHTKYYHQIAALLCMSSISVRSIFENYFTYFYENASLLSNTNTKLIALLYAFLFKKDTIDWKVLKVCSLEPNSPRNTVHTRVFLKYLLLNLRENLDFTCDTDTEGELSRRLRMEHRQNDFADIFPYLNHTVEQFFTLKNAVGENLPNQVEILADRIEHMKYCVIYFASLGLASIRLVHTLEENLNKFQHAFEKKISSNGMHSKSSSGHEDGVEEPEPKAAKLSLLESRLSRIRKD